MVYKDGNKGLDKIYLIVGKINEVGEYKEGRKQPGVRLVHEVHMKCEFVVFGYGQLWRFQPQY